MDILIASLILIGLCMIGLCFNIIFRKNGKFPETEVGHNKDMRKMGIHCAKDDELKMWKKRKSAPKCTAEDCSSCGENCGL